MPDWLGQAWVALTGWLLFVAAAARVIQTTYAAERDRRALAAATAEREKLDLEIRQLRHSLGSADLQREKLAVEIQLLRNSPEVVADRRLIYDRLRTLLGGILRDGSATLDQVRTMHGILHDSEFAYPRAVSNQLVVLTKSIFELYWSHRMLAEPPPGMTEAHREISIADNHVALNDVATFESEIVEIFRPHLNRAGD